MHTTCRPSARTAYVLDQWKSAWHLIPVFIFGFSWLLTGVISYAPVVVLTTLFLVTALPMALRMLVFGLIVAGLVAVFPVLAPVAVVIGIIFFLARIGFILEHWRPIVSGLAIYLFAIHICGLNIQTVYGHYGQGCPVSPVAACVVATLAVHVILSWLYMHGYTSKSAISIMGAAPLILISLVIPFLLKSAIDGFGHANAHDFGAHHVDVGHSGSDGLVHVNSHVRTYPDGIVENNLSYHGEHPLPPGKTIPVSGHVRTLPDGVEDNNLSS